MPELPEVETARRIVERELTGRTLVAVECRLPKLLRFSDPPTLDPLLGKRLLGARRRAKILIIDWSDDLSLALHLKMTGQIIIERDGKRAVAGHPVPAPDGPLPHRSTHIEFRFDDGANLYLSDVRQFGWLRLMDIEAVGPFIESLTLGPEGTGEGAIDVGRLAQKLRKRSAPIKAALLDQSVIAGIGNIYVDEALHKAKIHPTRPARSITVEELERIAEAVAWALDEGVAQGGAKIRHGRAYPVNGFPEVHAREGELCPACGATIIKTAVRGRGTYLCPVCQPELTDEGLSSP